MERKTKKLKKQKCQVSKKEKEIKEKRNNELPHYNTNDVKKKKHTFPLLFSY